MCKKLSLYSSNKVAQEMTEMPCEYKYFQKVHQKKKKQKKCSLYI